MKRLLHWLLLLGLLALPCNVGAETPTGSCVAGDCENGSGTYILPDGTKYVGEFKGVGIAHGQGRIIYPSGNTYEGEFDNDEYEGMGTLTTEEGTYVGHFRKGKMEGEGTFVYRNGGVYVGLWHNGQYHGKGTYVYPSGHTLIGEWDEGKIVGKKNEAGNQSNAASGK